MVVVVMVVVVVVVVMVVVVMVVVMVVVVMVVVVMVVVFCLIFCCCLCMSPLPPFFLFFFGSACYTKAKQSKAEQSSRLDKVSENPRTNK